ncbi:hypothetical protein C6571_19275 (plasmid) [Simplicispira suum]|uniref:Uncharacterized protein n=2 Tax=Simplicispira suum TaxID=2109915 RepID=A0A2S0N641_9BURK|nr:hypothetical protein C6571_19275 [Simplicispira suum]
MGMPKDKLYITLGLPRASVQRKASQDKRLSPDASSRVLGMKRLIGQVQSIVEESGNLKGFDAAAWVATWLDQEAEVLGGQKPSKFMDTPEGQLLVSQLIARTQSGAYS